MWWEPNHWAQRMDDAIRRLHPALYHGNAALLTESLEVIQRTSALILSAIEPPAVKSEEETTDAAAIAEVA